MLFLAGCMDKLIRERSVIIFSSEKYKDIYFTFFFLNEQNNLTYDLHAKPICVNISAFFFFWTDKFNNYFIFDANRCLE